MSHPFFDDLDFKALQNKSLEAPYLPELSSDAFDVSNFEQELTARTTFQDGHLSITNSHKSGNNSLKRKTIRQSVFKGL